MQIQAVWIGGGAAAKEEQLARAGIQVTGWLSPQDLAAALDKTDLYLHSAAWEGFPIAVLDAVARRRPIIVRDIPAFDGLSPDVKGDAAVQSVVAAVLDDGFDDWANANIRYWTRALQRNSSQHQAAALLELWATPISSSDESAHV